MNVQIRWGSGHNFESSVYIVYITNHFQTIFFQRGGGDLLVEVNVNSKEENSEDFCLNYVQELGL